MECTERNRISRALEPSIFRNLITRVLIIYYVNLTRSTALEQKRFDLRSMSSALVISSTFFGNYVSVGDVALCSSKVLKLSLSLSFFVIKKKRKKIFRVLSSF